jgi:hypothetical protein
MAGGRCEQDGGERQGRDDASRFVHSFPVLRPGTIGLTIEDGVYVPVVEAVKKYVSAVTNFLVYSF